MGWWDKFFGKPSQERGKESIKKIKFSALKNWLQEKQATKVREVEKEAQPLIKEVLHTLEELKELTLELKKKDIPLEVPKRAKKVIQTAKPDFVEGILRSIKVGEDLPLAKFQSSLSESLDKIGKLLASKGRYLPLAFSEEIAQIGKKANELLGYGDKLKEFSGKDKNMEKCFSQYEKIEQFQRELKNLADAKEKLKQNLIKLNQKKENLEERYKKIEKSAKMKRFRQEEVQQEDLVQKHEKVEAELYNFLSPLKRPLKKFRKYLSAEGRGRPELQGYLEDPLSQFLNTPEEPLLEILKEIRDNFQKLKLKQQDLNKVEGALNEFDELKKLKAHYFQLESKQKAIQGELLSSRVVEEKEDMNHELESVQREIILEEEKLEKIKGKEVEKEISNLKLELQARINKIAGRKIKIKFTS